MSDQSSPYDSQFFESFPTPERHVQRLATLATLFGLTPPNLSEAKILEIGCGTGMHVIAQAYDLPNAEFLAIDHSREQIHHAKQMALQAGCPSVKFLHGDISERLHVKGTFDYILCHGLYSWTTPHIQKAILGFMKEVLSPHGICALSYNCLPGWSVRSGIHAALLHFDAPDFSDEKRILRARSLLKHQQDTLVDASELHECRLKEEVERCLKRSDAFILHELLNPHSHGLYLKDVIEQAAGFKLSYIGDTRPQRMHRPSLREDVQPVPEELRGNFASPSHYEVYYDNLYPQALRYSVFSREDCTPEALPVRETLLDMYLTSPLVPLTDPVPVHDDSTVEFGTPYQDTVDVQNRLLKAALTILHRSWPEAIRGSELFELSRQMLGVTGPFGHLEEQFCNLLLRHFPAQTIEFYIHPLRCSSQIGNFPRVSQLARYQVQNQSWVTTLRHEAFPINELHRRIIPLCDGKHSSDEIFNLLAKELKSGALKIQEEGQTLSGEEEGLSLLRQGVQNGLEELREAALLVQD